VQRLPQNRFSLVQNTKQNLLSVGAIFTVFALTLLFQVRFQPGNYQLKGLAVLFMMTRKWPVDPQWGSIKVLVQLWSNLVKHEILFRISVSCHIQTKLGDSGHVLG
jgi:hypothetical protein